MPLFWFLQNSNARSCFKISLIPPALVCIMLYTIDKSEKRKDLIQFQFFRYEKDGSYYYGSKRRSFSTQEVGRKMNFS